MTHKCASSDTDKPPCKDACIHRGRYCALGARAGGDAHAGKYNGRDVVAEAKRRLCAAEVARKAKDGGAWWAYAAAVGKECTMSAGKFGDAACAAAALKSAGIDAAAVEKCVGDMDADESPDVMEENYDAQVWREGGGGGGGGRGRDAVAVAPTPTKRPAPSPLPCSGRRRIWVVQGADRPHRGHQRRPIPRPPRRGVGHARPLRRLFRSHRTPGVLGRRARGGRVRDGRARVLDAGHVFCVR